MGGVQANKVKALGVFKGMTKGQSKPVFRPYHQHQMMLLPASLDDMVAGNHPVRTISQVIDGLNIDPLLAKYKGGGSASYHPRMLLKVLVYAYTTNVYSSRKIEEACQQNIHFLWLSGMQKPDHHTINRFRSERLKHVFRQVFTQVVHLLAAEGILSLKEIYVDGTKIEANANRYTFVWGNAIKTNKEKMAVQLKELWQYAQSIAKEEMGDDTPTDFSPISPEKVKETVEKIDAALRDNPDAAPKARQKVAYAKKHWPEALERYNRQEQILAGRNSYSKTDPDATFMRMKEDHMKNGQLKPGYNVQISGSKQCIVSYSIHPNPTDTLTLAPHLEQFEKALGRLPQTLTADAGYGSEQNYELLAQKGIEAYVKYGYFDKDQSESERSKRPFTQDKLHYNKEKDCYICPIGQPMENIGQTIKKTQSGYIQKITRYQAKNCEGCPMRGLCHKGSGNRILEVNHNLNKHKQDAHQALTSEAGKNHRKRRPVEVEPIFGNIKENHRYRRFMLRGHEKVEIEFGLLALAQNLRKKCRENGKKEHHKTGKAA